MQFGRPSGAKKSATDPIRAAIIAIAADEASEGDRACFVHRCHVDSGFKLGKCSEDKDGGGSRMYCVAMGMQ